MNAVANGAMYNETSGKNGYGGIWAPWAPGSIGVMVLGFIAFWPVGLAVLSYNIWGTWWSNDNNGSGWSGRSKRGGRKGPHKKWGKHTSGNTAFDAYKTETLKRLEEEEQAFKTFIEELRQAKDREEFDRFMRDRNTVVPNDEQAPAQEDKPTTY